MDIAYRKLNFVLKINKLPGKNIKCNKKKLITLDKM